MVTAPQVSEAETPPVKLGTVAVPAKFGQIVWSGAQVVMVGAVTSCTVTVKLQGAVFPEPSVAVQFTRVSPRLKVLPDAGVHSTVAVPASSVAVTVKLTTAE